MKILYVTTIGGTMRFFRDLIRNLLDDGHQVDIATNESARKVPECYREWGCTVYPISCSRKPFNTGNIRAVKEIRKIVSENGYDIVHCHTPVAAACTRFACRGLRKKNGTRVIYTAHGFHFYKGAPKVNWLVYYPMEKICSRWTDTLITINTEDYRRASKQFRAKETIYVPGVGIDTEKFGAANGGQRIRDEFGIDGFMLLSVGELNENKNHETVIRALENKTDLTYVIAGPGKLADHLAALAQEKNVRVILPGFRTDVMDFYDAADAYILPSHREGLNVSLMEAMACGLPCLCGRIRGNTDLVDEKGGYLFNPSDPAEIRKCIESVMQAHEGMGGHNRNKIKHFDIKTVIAAMRKIYGIG